MVKTIDKAKRIQARRAAAGKRGLSKAVAAFLRRTGANASALK